MRVGLAIFSLVLAACAAPEIVNSTTSTPAPPVQPEAATTTTMPALQIEVQDCSAPQVTFSILCETVRLIEGWYVDRPADTEELVEAALSGLGAYQTSETEEPPRVLFCAVPNEAFILLCDALAVRIETESIPIGPAIEAAVASMVDTSLGPFTYYVPPDQTGSFRSNGVVGGVGILLDATDAVGSKCARITETCDLRIVFVLEDNPGFDAGLLTDDVIISIDGEPVDGLGFVEATSLIAGDETGVVGLTVQRNGAEHEYSITRSELVVPTVEVEVTVPGVGYMRIPDFEDDIPALVLEGFELFGDELLRTIVIDLRDNPGGYVDSAVDVLSEFVDGGTVFVETDGVDEYEYTATEGGLGVAADLIVLVNNGTASAAEVTAASLRDTRGAVVIGQPTFGKDAVQIAFDLNNGGEFHLAVGRWLSPNRLSVAGTGLIPDVEVDLPAGMSVDEVVEAALEAAR